MAGYANARRRWVVRRLVSLAGVFGLPQLKAGALFFGGRYFGPRYFATRYFG